MKKVIEMLYLMFNNFFIFTNKVHDKILNLNVEKNGKLMKGLSYSFIVSLIIVSLILYFNHINIIKKISFFIVLVIAIVYSIVNILIDMKKMLTSVRGWFELFIYTYIGLFSVITFLVTKLLNLFKVNENVQVIIAVILLPIIWIFISCCVETKVSVLCNTILATMNGIIYQIWSFFKLFGEDFRAKLNINIEFEKLNLLVSSILLFTTVTLAITAMICAIKKYWEEKKQ